MDGVIGIGAFVMGWREYNFQGKIAEKEEGVECCDP